MKKRKKLPLKMRTIIKSLKKIKKESILPVSILVAGEEDVGKNSLIDRLAIGSNEVFSTVELSDKNILPDFASRLRKANLILVVVDVTGKISKRIKNLLTYLEESKLPFLLVINKIDLPKNLEAQLEPASNYLGKFVSKLVLISVKKDININNELIPAIIDRSGGKKLSLAASLPVFKLPIIEEIIKSTAAQNAAIAGIPIYPGANMPILTTNQIKMILKIAVVYDKEIDVSRAKEVIMVVGGGFTFRAIARGLVSFLPVIGLVTKAAIAYCGTVAIGKTANKYFEKGISDLSVDETWDMAAEAARKLKVVN